MRPERFSRSASVRPADIRLLLLALMISQPVMVWAADTPPQLSTPAIYDSALFESELQRLEAGLDDAGKSAENLRAYREALPEYWTVDAAGHRYAVPTNSLAARLTKAEKQPEARAEQLKEARDYLDSLAAETDSLSSQPLSRMDSARDKLNAILAHSEYKSARQHSWYDKLRDRVDEIVASVLDHIFRRLGGERTVGSALLWISLCGAVIFIAYWVFRNWLRAARATEMNLETASIPSLSWQEWMFAAREAAERQDYRMAIHCAYWAGIARLQDLGVLAHDRSKTPREYLRALTKSQAVVAESAESRTRALALLTVRLEKSWYGHQTATQSDFQESLTEAEVLGCRRP